MKKSQLADLFSSKVETMGYEAGLRAVVEEIAGADRETLVDVWRAFASIILRGLERTRRLRVIGLTAQAALSVLIPIGNSGARAQLGKVTRVQLLVIADLREQQAKTAHRHGEVIRKIAAKVGKHTVREAWGTLTATDRRELLEALGCTVPAETQKIA